MPAWQTLMDFVRDMARAFHACCRAFEIIEAVHERSKCTSEKVTTTSCKVH